MAAKRMTFGPGEIEVEIGRVTRSGRPMIEVAAHGVKLRIALEDAESIAEALLAQVRAAEAQS